MDKKELYSYTGNESQLYGVMPLQFAGGRLFHIYTAGGLAFDVLPDMGLDIGRLSFNGINMSYLSKNGYDSSWAFLPYESEFMNTFPGGMLYTCGLRSVGPPNRDKGEWQPQHGRFHGLQASQMCACVQDKNIIISAVFRESALFGHVLQLKRIISVPVWGSSITIEDTIENLTPNAEEYMLLYHFNFGYPMLSEDAKLVLPSVKGTQPRCAEAEKGIDNWHSFSRPINNEAEQVFFHNMDKGEARLENEKLGILAKLSWSADTLPVFAQWKSMARGDYVLGLEPANNYIMGRSAERENGTIKTINAFESINTKTKLDFKEMSK